MYMYLDNVLKCNTAEMNSQPTRNSFVLLTFKMYVKS